jgi:hypothetical protein
MISLICLNRVLRQFHRLFPLEIKRTSIGILAIVLKQRLSKRLMARWRPSLLVCPQTFRNTILHLFHRKSLSLIRDHMPRRLLLFLHEIMTLITLPQISIQIQGNILLHSTTRIPAHSLPKVILLPLNYRLIQLPLRVIQFLLVSRLLLALQQVD